MASISYASNSDCYYDREGASISLDQQSVGSNSFELGRSMVSNFQFIDQSDMLVKLSRAVFEDFQRHVSEGSTNFRDILQLFLETCDFAVRTIEKLSEDKAGLDRNSCLILNQLTMERNAYELIVKLMDSEDLASKNQDANSYLTKLFKDDQEFRRLATLLHWSEEIAFRNPDGFSRFGEDVRQFDDMDNIYAYSSMRGKPVHIDSRFSHGDMDKDDEESCRVLHKVLFSLIRSGRLSDAKCLLENVGLSSIASFIFLREFLTNPNLSPMDPLHDNYNLSKSRAYFKQTARNLIPIDDEGITSVDQCIWAALSGSLPTLLSHASTTNDRLWAYISCAVESLLDNLLLVEHSKSCEEMLVIKKALDEEIPNSVASIFTEIRNNETNPYYCLYGHFATSNWQGALNYIETYLEIPSNELPAHELRFFTHVALLIKVTEVSSGLDLTGVTDKLISLFTDLLIDMKLYGLVPSYLIHLSAEKCNSKMLDFLEGIECESEQKEVLSVALDVGFQVTELCKDVYQRFKRKHKITGDNDETARSASEMLRAWKWLTYGGVETIWDSIVEANYLLRKLFMYSRVAEAVELLSVTPANLSAQVQDAFQQEFEGHFLPTPDRLSDAQQEYDCYILYFEAMTKYGAWLKHVEGPAPELPAKLSDEHWARMDIKRRAEYEFSVQKSRDLLQKHIRLSEMLKKRCVELLKKVVCRPEGWLLARDGDDESEVAEDRERAADFLKIRESYFFHVLKTLVDVHERAGETTAVLDISNLLVDPRYDLHKALSKNDLRRLLGTISKSGAALL